MIMVSFTTLWLLFLSLFASMFAAAAPVEPAKRDVWSPTLTYPHAGTIWYVGQRHNVTWETWDAPTSITDRYGVVTFRFDGIYTPLVLADNFALLDGRVEVTVPNVLKGDNYSLILWGEGDNSGPAFSIYGLEM